MCQRPAVSKTRHLMLGPTCTERALHTAYTQVEVHCGERGRVLAYTWNAFLSTYEGMMRSLTKSNQELSQANTQVSDYAAPCHAGGSSHVRQHWPASLENW